MKRRNFIGVGVALPALLSPFIPSPVIAAEDKFQGDPVNVRYGVIQVEITVSDGKITDAQALKSPEGSNQRWTDMAIPVMRQKTLTAQSSEITGVSGASYTSLGWQQSLASAIAAANLKGALKPKATEKIESTGVSKSSGNEQVTKFILQAWDGLPSNLLTPGALNKSVNQENISSTICSKSFVAKQTPSTSALNKIRANQIKAGYVVDGLNDPQLYEEDLLVPVNLGGDASNEKNLWPQIIDGTNGASAKNRLENSLNAAVCKGQMSLEQAQNAISNDWTGAFAWILGGKTGTRYKDGWEPNSPGLIGMNFTGGKSISCSMNKGHSIDLNMYGITSWTLAIDASNGDISDSVSWNIKDNVYSSLSYGSASSGIHTCDAKIYGEKGLIASIRGELTINEKLEKTRAVKFEQTIVGKKLVWPTNSKTVSGAIKVFKNCTELSALYSGGIALPGASNKGGKTTLTPTYDRAMYNANTKLDRDKDGIACEK